MYLEELGETVEGLIVPGEEDPDGQVEVARAQLHVDLPVHLRLHLSAVVHPDPALLSRHLGFSLLLLLSAPLLSVTCAEGSWIVRRDEARWCPLLADLSKNRRLRLSADS
jgi:hypothetical protein